MHGTQASYSRGCHCWQCCDAHAAYMLQWKADRAAGITGYLPADEARAHIHRLHARCSYRAIALSSGVSLTTVRAVAYGAKTVQRNTHEALMACTGIPGSGHVLVDAAPTLRLMAKTRSAGVTRDEIAREMGRQSSGSLPRRGTVHVWADTAARIRRACAALGVHERAKHQATHRLVGIKELADLYGADIDAIAEAAGCTPDALDQARHRKVSEDFAERVARAFAVPLERVAEVV